MSEPSIPVDESNLIVKALQLLEEHAGLQDQYHISVDKRVPAGAGLGGGSANAAAVVRMVNKVASLGLAAAELAEVGLRIGADVPFFIYNNVGIGRGLGHEIEICDIQPDACIVFFSRGPAHARQAPMCARTRMCARECEPSCTRSCLLARACACR